MTIFAAATRRSTIKGSALAGTAARVLKGIGLTLGIGYALVAPGAALAREPEGSNVLLRDSFPIGNSNGALCQVQSDLSDPAFSSMFDRAWIIICRDAAQPVGRVFALRSPDAIARINARDSAPGCAPISVSETRASAECSAFAAGVPGKRYAVRRGSTTYVAEGIGVYDDAIRLALDSIMAGHAVPGTISIATISVGDPEALARVQAGTLPADRALAEGYRRNNSGDYASAATYFEALERRNDVAGSGVEPTEFTLNRALQVSNLGDFAEAERLFSSVEAVPTTDIVQIRLRRNFRAINALNQGDLTGALTFLDQHVQPVMSGVTATNGAIVISPVLATGINSGASSQLSSQLSSETKLTPEERAILLDAQAEQLRGSVERLKGNLPAARGHLAQAMARALAVRNGRVTTIVRLRSQIMGEQALVEEADGKLGEADSFLSNAVHLLEVEYPETLALAAARARRAAFMSRHDRGDEAVTLYRAVIAALVEQRRQLTGVYNQMGPYYRLLVERQARDPGAIGEFFLAAQLLVRPGVADTQATLARELSGGSGDAAALFRQANTLTRDLERARIELARLNALDQPAATAQLRNEAQVQIDGLATQQIATLARLASFPQYRAVSQDAVSLADLQASLHSDEAYAKMVVIGDDVYVMFITPTTSKLWRADVTRPQLDAAVDRIRSSISVYEGGAYNTYPFDAEASHQLYTQLFGPVASEITQHRHLVFEPDGAMLRLPPGVFITDTASIAAYRARAGAAGGDPFDMRGVAWLGRQARISTAVSPLAFRSTRNAPPSRATRSYLGFGHNTPVSNVTQVAAVRAMDPASATGCQWGLDQWNRPIAATELNEARGMIGGEVVTGNAFTDKRLLARQDLGDYRIIHFTTHGLVTPPRPDCPTDPALLTSFDTSDSDGLLSFDEIFGMHLDADLVILSACDTAGEASIAATRAAGVTTGGGTALDGLVRAFVGAGGRTVLASHWVAPDDFHATERLIAGLFNAGPGVSIDEALGRAEDALMDDPQTSHPYYWAGFAIIGDGARPVITTATPSQAAADPGHHGRGL